MTFSRLGAELGKAAFKNPKGAAQVATGLRNAVGPEQVDDLMGALLSQAKNLVQPEKQVNRGIDVLKGLGLIGGGAGGALLVSGLMGGGGDESNTSTVNPVSPNTASDPNANTNNSPSGTTAFQSGQVSDPTSLDGYLEAITQGMKDRRAQFETVNSPEYLQAATDRQRDAKLALNAQLLESIEGRTAEKSRREESISRINAWKAIEQETIRANKDIALGLASVAYQAGTPNAATLSALSPIVQAGASSFVPGASVLGSLRR
tara:strand:+ start:9281 stop:10066 length:786 start_codon:yes stop_codon:yes gene_type:complete